MKHAPKSGYALHYSRDRACCCRPRRCARRLLRAQHYLSGAPYAWRVWLALELKRIPYELKTISHDGGDFKSPAFFALNPRQRVPVIVEDGFALYESAAIVEYLEDKQPEIQGQHQWQAYLDKCNLNAA